MIDVALCLAIQSMPSFSQQPYVTTSTVTRQIPGSHLAANTTVTDSLLAASLGNCQYPLNGPPPTQCSSAPPPERVPTKPNPSQAQAMRLYLNRSLRKC